MRVLLSTYGTRGDVEPVVALALQVQALGAEVRVCAPPDDEFADLAARAGVPLVPFGRPWHAGADGTAGSSSAEERVVNPGEFVAGYIAATFDTLVEAAQDCDVLLATGMLHFVAQSVAEQVAVPHRFVVFCPVLDAPQRDAVVGAPINSHRASIGLPPVEDVRGFLFTDHPWMAADPTLHPPQAAGPGRTGAWILPDRRPLPDELVAFLDAGPAPVYLGFGSMRVPQDSAGSAVEAVRAQGRRALLARGRAGLTLVDDSDDCLVVGEVNQQALFGRVAAVVHHGGAGTTTAAARAGAPQVVVPQVADQFYWAGRVAELGIGAAHDGPSPERESLSAALATALTPEVGDRARTVAGAIRTDGASVAAARLLEAAGGGGDVSP